MHSAEHCTNSKLAVFISFSGEGGVERMVLNLLQGFVDRGVRVDLLAVLRNPGADLAVPAGVNLVDLGTKHTFTALPALIRYLRKEKPGAMLVAKDRAIRVAVLARIFSGSRVRLVGRLGTNLTTALMEHNPLSRWFRLAPLRWMYQRVDHIVAVSHGVAMDTVATSRMSANKISVVRNPVITPSLPASAAEKANHPWFADDGAQIILGAGRLTRQKDFPTLIKAFAKLRKERNARLLIIGEGRQRSDLQRLAEELDIADDFSMPGFQSNPYPFIRHADLFVLSSAWEGSPNVLTEALALGIPSVATNCPSGPQETLDGGRYGPLVPVGDVQALAEAMIATLDNPLPDEILRAAVAEYRLDASANAYLELLGLAEHATTRP